MLLAFEKVMLVVQPIALAVFLIYLYGLFCRSIRNPQILKFVMGGMFGFAAAMAMLSPIPIADGVIVDIRNLFIGIASAFFGVLGGSVALLIGAAMRVSIGGDGVLLGVVGMMVASIMGGLWAFVIRPRIAAQNIKLLLLAFMISHHLVVAMFLPPEIRDDFFLGLGPTLLAANLIGTLLLGNLIIRERHLLAEAHQLKDDAARDPLTKLINRKSAEAAFAALPATEDAPDGQSMFCIDVDGFKEINDTCGHLYGDAVLVEISDRLSACLRPQDIISRISGDEFVIVLHAVTCAQAQAVAERCRAAISSEPVMINTDKVHSSISVGAVWTQLALSFNGLREKADEALYRAKSNGRDCVIFEIDSAVEPFGKHAAA